MKLLYGTGNQAKLHSMRQWLDGMDIELMGLWDMEAVAPEVAETGKTPLENARTKALEYYQIFKTPVFSCDMGLYIEGLAPEKQPGVDIRTIAGKRLNDQETLDYYVKLIKEQGGECLARYQNAICLVLDDKRVYEYDGKDIWGEAFLMTDEPHQELYEGYPLDSISIDIRSEKYYVEMDSVEFDIERGFRQFFTRVFESIK